jgi:hypothetical protein
MKLPPKQILQAASSRRLVSIPALQNTANLQDAKRNSSGIFALFPTASHWSAFRKRRLSKISLLAHNW